MVENHFSTEGYHVKAIRYDCAGMNIPSNIKIFCSETGIVLKTSPASVSEGNGLVERIVQEHWTRGNVFQQSTNLSKKFWGEAINHANWHRN